MALRKIRYEQDEILRKKSKYVTEITPRIITLLEDMAETLRDRDGVGLAAPQVGVLKRIILVDNGEELLELINPEILESTGTQCGREGCLSIPGKAGIVERPAYVKVKAQDRTGKEIVVEGTEVTAVVLCHEMDHLDGVLYVDKMIRFVSDEEGEEEQDDED